MRLPEISILVLGLGPVGCDALRDQAARGDAGPAMNPEQFQADFIDRFCDETEDCLAGLGVELDCDRTPAPAPDCAFVPGEARDCLEEPWECGDGGAVTVPTSCARAFECGDVVGDPAPGAVPTTDTD